MGIVTAPPLRGRGSPAWTSKVSGRMLPASTAARSIGTDAVARICDRYSSRRLRAVPVPATLARMRQTRLYERVCGKLEEAMRVGALRPGDRLPSVRRLSERERVSVSTVLQAYLKLESRGLIEARPQSGHYVRWQRPLPPEPPPTSPAPGATPVTVSALVAKVVDSARDPDLVPLGCNQPDPDLFPWRRLGRIAAGIAREGGGFTYELPPGARSLRRQLARRSLDWGCTLSPEDFIVTCGAMEAVQLSLVAVARQGDAIAIESPAYFGSLQLIEALGLKAVEIPSSPRQGMDLDITSGTCARCASRSRPRCGAWATRWRRTFRQAPARRARTAVEWSGSSFRAASPPSSCTTAPWRPGLPSRPAPSSRRGRIANIASGSTAA